MYFYKLGQKLDAIVCRVVGHEKQMMEGISWGKEKTKIETWNCKRCGYMNWDGVHGDGIFQTGGNANIKVGVK